MPICIPNQLPAREILERENIFIMNEIRASHQDIRPLRIAILNLMPTKIVTETQLLRLLSNTPLQLEITLLQTATHVSKNTSSEHLNTFYRDYDEVKNEKFDGLIVTGAPVENLDFEEVDYWEELCGIMDWARTNVHCSLYICWGAQAALYHKYGIPKYPLDKKMFGVFEHDVLHPSHELVRGFDEVFWAPHSRHSQVKEEDIHTCKKLEILVKSKEAGVFLIASKSRRSFFITGHIEYDYNTLALEYERDVCRGLSIEVPKYYFPNDDPKNRPVNTWRGHAHLMFANWLNYFVYQETPYDINKILPSE